MADPTGGATTTEPVNKTWGWWRDADLQIVKRALYAEVGRARSSRSTDLAVIDDAATGDQAVTTASAEPAAIVDDDPLAAIRAKCAAIANAREATAPTPEIAPLTADELRGLPAELIQELGPAARELAARADPIVKRALAHGSSATSPVLIVNGKPGRPSTALTVRSCPP